MRDLGERLQRGDGEAVDGSSAGEDLFLEVFQVLRCMYRYYIVRKKRGKRGVSVEGALVQD